MDIKESINATRKGFEESFSSADFYNKQTQDSVHLKRIIDFLPIRGGMKILDFIKARKESVGNLSFVSYDGLDFPYTVSTLEIECYTK